MLTWVFNFFYKHIFRNAIGPIAHGIPGAIIFCISGALITEGVYSIPGMGKILPDSINIYNNTDGIMRNIKKLNLLFSLFKSASRQSTNI